jgi:hypothetical protein
MQRGSQGPIRGAGWALPLPDLVQSAIRANSVAVWALYLSLMVAFLGLDGALLFAQHSEPGHEAAAGGSADHGHDHHALTLSPDGWEGSKAGMAYSLGWARMLLPAALLGAAAFLLVWSDHEAWPIGSLSFAETFLGNDHEILQHKTYGLLALAVGLIELYRRLDRLTHVGWLAPLPLFAMIGGLMLFTHSHGAHPSAEKIALHHAVMGTLAVSAGSSRLASAWGEVFMGWSRSRWEAIWAGLILLIGLQLLVYSE